MCVKQDTREHEHNIHLVVCNRAVSPTSNNRPRTVMHVQLHSPPGPFCVPAGSCVSALVSDFRARSITWSSENHGHAEQSSC